MGKRVHKNPAAWVSRVFLLTPGQVQIAMLNNLLTFTLPLSFVPTFIPSHPMVQFYQRCSYIVRDCQSHSYLCYKCITYCSDQKVCWLKKTYPTLIIYQEVHACCRCSSKIIRTGFNHFHAIHEISLIKHCSFLPEYIWC